MYFFKTTFLSLILFSSVAVSLGFASTEANRPRRIASFTELLSHAPPRLPYRGKGAKGHDWSSGAINVPLDQFVYSGGWYYWPSADSPIVSISATPNAPQFSAGFIQTFLQIPQPNPIDDFIIASRGDFALDYDFVISVPPNGDGTAPFSDAVGSSLNEQISYLTDGSAGTFHVEPNSLGDVNTYFFLHNAQMATVFITGIRLRAASLAPPPISQDGNPTNGSCDACASGSVNASSGSMSISSQDFSIPAPSSDIGWEFDHSYTTSPDTQSASGSGEGWQSNFDTYVQPESSGRASGSNLKWIDPRGGPNLFTLQSDGTYKAPGGQRTKLAAFSDHYEIQLADRTTYFFDSSIGYLTKIIDKTGAVTTVNRGATGKISSIVSPFSGSVSFSYNNTGDISQVRRDRDSLSYSYSFDSSRRLISKTDFAGRTWIYTYAGGGGSGTQNLIATITDPLGRVSDFSYDSHGRVIRKGEPGGGVWRYVYGDHATSVTAPNGGITKYFFDANLKEVRRILPDGTVINSRYNAQGFLVAQGYEMGGETHYGYDANGNQISVQRPLDPVPSTTVFDPIFRVPTLVTPIVGASTASNLDPNTGYVLTKSRGGLTLSYTRDQFGNILSTNNGIAIYTDQRDSTGLLTRQFDLHNPITFTYDSRSRVIQKTFQNGRVISYTYNDDDRVMRIADSAGPSTTNVYDAMGRLTQRTVSAGGVNQVTSYVYDDRDRLVSTTDPLGRVTTNHYDPVHVIDKPSSVTDPAGRTTYFVYDLLQRLIRKTDALGAVTSYTWDQRGNMTSVTDANGNVTRYAFDLNNRKIREDRPSVAGTAAARRVTEYFYDGADHLVREVTKSATGGADRIIAYTYDSLDRLVHKTVERDGAGIPDDDSSFTYENQLDATLMKSAVNGVSSLSFTNEAAPPFSSTGFATAASQSGNPLGLITGNFAVTRDVTGEISGVSKDGAALFTRNFDPAGRLTGVQAGSFSSTLGYDGFGHRISIQHSDGALGAFTFDLLGRQVSSSWTGPAPVAEQITFDLAGNPAGIQRENGTSSLSYDSSNQLTSSAGLYSKTFAYDLLGNRLQDSANGAGSFISNFLISTGGSSFTADLDGFGDTVREVTGGVTKSFAYRADGILSAMQSGNIQVAYYFDALGRRVAKAFNLGGVSFSESFLDMGNQDQVLIAKAGDGSLTTFLEGSGEHLGEIKNGVAKGYVTDHLGSVLNGEVAGPAHSIGLFGEASANVVPSPTSSPVNYAYAGYDYDPALGQYTVGPRTFNPVTGRWLSQDPIGFDGGDSNFYRYVQNQPTILTDPSGLYPASPPGGDQGPDPTWNLEQDAENAWRYALKVFGSNSEKVKSYRHCMASCLIGKVTDSSIANALGYIYETAEDIGVALGKYGSNQSTRDKFNNAVGAALSSNPGACPNTCFEAVENGCTINQSNK